MTSWPPYALFVLSEDIDADWINDSLTRSWKHDFACSWSFWVATDYKDMPPLREDGSLPDGTKPPLPKDFKSAFIGKSILECAKWIRQMPPDASVNRNDFAVLTEHSKTDDTFTSCQIVDLEDHGDIDVEYFPVKVDLAGMESWTNDAGKFHEKADVYRAVCREKGYPDRSYVRNPW